MDPYMTCGTCSYNFFMNPFVRFNKNVALDKARETNAFLPKFEAKLGVDCPRCGKFQKWLTQEEALMLDKRFYQGEPARDYDGCSVHTASSANLLRVRVKTNCPQGGDAGHGGRTTLELKDEGGTAMWVNGQEADRVSIMLGGDSEYHTLIECLEFAVRSLKEQHRMNR